MTSHPVCSDHEPAVESMQRLPFWVGSDWVVHDRPVVAFCAKCGEAFFIDALDVRPDPPFSEESRGKGSDWYQAKLLG